MKDFALSRIESDQSSDAASQLHTLWRGAWPLAVAVLLGLTVLWGVAFAQPSGVHEAMHDLRHAQGLPCH